MRFGYALIAMFLWTIFLSCAGSAGFTFTDDIILLSVAIVAAGALAGGE